MGGLPHIVHLPDRITLRISRSCLFEHLHTLGKVQTERFVKEDKVVAGELLLNRLDLMRECRLESLEDGQEQVVERVHDFVVVLLNRHLQIETDKLGHMTMSVRIFRPEDWLISSTHTL